MNQPVNDGGPFALVRRVLHYLQLRLDYTLLQGQGLAKQVLSTFFAGIMQLVLAGVCISFMGLALATALAEWLGHLAWGLLAVGLLFSLLLLALVLHTTWLEKLIARRLERHFQALTLPESNEPEPPAGEHGNPTIGAATDARHGT